MGFYRLALLPTKQLPPSLLEHQFPPGIDRDLVLGFLKHIHYHRPENHETEEKIIEVRRESSLAPKLQRNAKVYVSDRLVVVNAARSI